jgi:hypothetical protein
VGAEYSEGETKESFFPGTEGKNAGKQEKRRPAWHWSEEDLHGHFASFDGSG